MRAYAHDGTFAASYTVVVGNQQSSGIASDDTHFYIWIWQSGSDYTGHAYRLSDGGEDTSAAFDITGGPSVGLDGLAIQDGFVWMLGRGVGPIVRVPFPNDDYREIISGTLTAIQPTFGEMYTLSSTADGNKWLKQTQLPL